MRIAPEGWVVLVPMVLVAAGVSVGGVLLWPLAGYVLSAVLGLLVFWGFWFFRDPVRTPESTDPLAVISPADGKVISVDLAELPKELRASTGTDPGPVPRVSIFLNLFDVHVNRVVVAGTIEKIVYTPGQFVNASFDKASELNERSVVLMRDDAGRVLAFAQIAGLVARRIVNHLKEGQRVKAGERFGLIRFGSRAEIWMPAGTQVRVKAGQRVLAGQSLLATLPAVG
ncbi:MAG: phosphatidylserine decarboxylase [bacterium]